MPSTDALRPDSNNHFAALWSEAGNLCKSCRVLPYWRKGSASPEKEVRHLQIRNEQIYKRLPRPAHHHLHLKIRETPNAPLRRTWNNNVPCRIHYRHHTRRQKVRVRSLRHDKPPAILFCPHLHHLRRPTVSHRISCRAHTKRIVKTKGLWHSRKIINLHNNLIHPETTVLSGCFFLKINILTT